MPSSFRPFVETPIRSREASLRPTKAFLPEEVFLPPGRGRLQGKPRKSSQRKSLSGQDPRARGSLPSPSGESLPPSWLRVPPARKPGLARPKPRAPRGARTPRPSHDGGETDTEGAKGRRENSALPPPDAQRPWKTRRLRKPNERPGVMRQNRAWRCPALAAGR